MKKEISTSNNLSVKDFSTIGIFCAIMFIVFMAYSMITGASMFYSMIFNAAGAAFILSPFFVYMSMKVGKNGPTFIYNAMFAIITGLMMGPFMIPWFIGGGILAEAVMIGKESYRSMVRITIAWVITCLVRAAHGMAEIWFFKNAFIATGVSEEQIAVQTQYYTDPRYVLLSLAVTVVLAVLGCAVSNKLVYKHFKKSGIVR
ncbi:MptD family putative ECF transporter S component [Clostridium sp. ZBS2]|uniref:MptD family putative ECF transporter S component n=1 Tax=Clostridium sp. ZBS2 TaxID=2949976 RepID=UPI00207A99C7|nr:MptD family putative ECF transporter S component [Clostridium sp. ZBS2]